jgi:ribosome maturation factor RimP
MEGWEGKVREMVVRAVTEAGHDLIGLEISRSRIHADIDRPAGGITIEECRQVSNEVSRCLDADNLLPGTCVLEVSSPGPQRPLAGARDFRRVTGRTVSVTLQQPYEDHREWTGTVQNAGADTVTLAVAGRAVVLPYRQMERARVKFEFSREEKA